MWIAIAIVSYFLLALSSLVDKHLLQGPLPSPKVYAFYVGILGGVVFLLIPLGFLVIPEFTIIVFALTAGAVRILGVLALFSGFHKFEVSRIVPALGGMLPIFTVILLFLFTGEKSIFSLEHFLAFVLLIVGTIVVTIEKHGSVSLQSLKYSMTTAFLFSVFIVFSKFVFDAQPFFSALIWLSVGYVLASFVFLVSKEVRQNAFVVFKRKKEEAEKPSLVNKTVVIIVGNQILGGGGVLLQNLAVALVPLGLLAFVNALAGIQYLFVFVLALLFSVKFPAIVKEEISSRVILQKIIAILFIGSGLVLLAF